MNRLPRKGWKKWGAGIFLEIVGVLLAGWVTVAPAADSSPYPNFIRGDDFFIPGQPLVGYVTVQPRFTAIENDSRNNIDNH